MLATNVRRKATSPPFCLHPSTILASHQRVLCIHKAKHGLEEKTIHCHISFGRLTCLCYQRTVFYFLSSLLDMSTGTTISKTRLYPNIQIQLRSTPALFLVNISRPLLHTLSLSCPSQKTRKGGARNNLATQHLSRTLCASPCTKSARF